MLERPISFQRAELVIGEEHTGIFCTFGHASVAESLNDALERWYRARRAAEETHHAG